jgi:hypothetical protein
MRRLVVPTLIAVTLLLTGCVPDGPGTSPTASPTRTPSSTPTPSATPTSPPTPTVEPGEPVGLACDQLITRDQMYAFNENYSLLDDWTPDGGSLAHQALVANGLACRWINQTSGTTIDVAVAHLSEAATAQKKANLVSSGAPVAPVFGAEGYFDGVVAEVFPGPFWLTAVSDAFGGDPGEAGLIVNPAIDNLSAVG